MLEISKVKVFGLEDNLIASGYPMLPEDPCERKLIARDFKRGESLGNAPKGSGHDIYLKGIIVQFDVKYSHYWTPHIQRYHFIDVVSSQSKLHRIMRMDIAKSCNKYVEPEIVAILESWVKIYNDFGGSSQVFIPLSGQVKNFKNSTYLSKGERFLVRIPGVQLTKYEVFMKVLSNTLLGFEMTMRMTTNYLQLKTIYYQRRYSKLKEDWGYFCDWVKTLPKFKKLCIHKEV